MHGFGVPGHKRIFHLQADQRMHRSGGADKAGAGFRQTHMADFAFVFEARHFADGVFDGHLCIGPRRAPDIDIIEAEADQTFLAI
jgi:hypothetical protein